MSTPAAPNQPATGQASGSCPSDESLIKDAEGLRNCMYYDTASPPVPTICYGQNLDNASAPANVAAVGGDFASVMAGTQCLSDQQCSTLL